MQSVNKKNLKNPRVKRMLIMCQQNDEADEGKFLHLLSTINCLLSVPDHLMNCCWTLA